MHRLIADVAAVLHHETLYRKSVIITYSPMGKRTLLGIQHAPPVRSLALCRGRACIDQEQAAHMRSVDTDRAVNAALPFSVDKVFSIHTSVDFHRCHTVMCRQSSDIALGHVVYHPDLCCE